MAVYSVQSIFHELPLTGISPFLQRGHRPPLHLMHLSLSYTFTLAEAGSTCPDEWSPVSKNRSAHWVEVNALFPVAQYQRPRPSIHWWVDHQDLLLHPLLVSVLSDLGGLLFTTGWGSSPVKSSLRLALEEQCYLEYLIAQARRLWGVPNPGKTFEE